MTTKPSRDEYGRAMVLRGCIRGKVGNVGMKGLKLEEEKHLLRKNPHLLKRSGAHQVMWCGRLEFQVVWSFRISIEGLSLASDVAILLQ